MKYKHLFFDLDHTLWDFDSNCRFTLEHLYQSMELKERGVDDFERFYKHYIIHNDRLWEKYRAGTIRSEDLRWKRMHLTLVDFKIGDEKLATEMSTQFLEMLPSRTILFPYTIEILTYLKEKGYQLHLITNGFEKTQHSKITYSGLSPYFMEVITSEGSNSLKPHKEIFDYAFLKTKALPEHSIMIGDSIEADIMGGINAGIDQVFVNHLNIEPSVKATYTVYSLKELENIF
ncbi:noncanonical pyrimidine nucleotidase, YjjG family [Pseudoflavitalea sp. G-6-1-2]|uniref:YjjG family noncanonical pyrimidine nucleotidase n=1 Tax=Pseudoflavitalea sp. G-6-1-2 TaxID=2728841 RepID=UPI00146F13DC|nr:YjjG family noncanonical pyrimidine nucleotidase [Pseudoflavitalea sp. G-6-1-2]NML19721.1 noncanonical pyrimidine nucleotidase, YjjG family [Pseudoflavitalea sp. G-6-1-2]